MATDAKEQKIWCAGLAVRYFSDGEAGITVQEFGYFK
jgi:hypothetical protein